MMTKAESPASSRESELADPSAGDTDEFVEADLLPICPSCGYSLRTLPIRHRCPECGLPFNREWRLFGFYKGKKDRVGKFSAAILFGMAGVCFALAFLGVPMGAWLPNVILLICFGVGVFFYRRQSRYVTVDESGVRVFRRARCIRHISWDDLQKVHYGTNPVVLTAGGQRVRLSLFNWQPIEADECIQAINRFRRASPNDAKKQREPN